MPRRATALHAAGRRIGRARPSPSGRPRNVTSESGTTGSPRRTRARYSPVAEPATARDLLRRALGHDAAAPGAALRSQVDDPVGRLDDVQVVLDDDDRVAGVHEPMEHLEQLLHVREVEARGGLVEDVDGPAGGAPRELRGQLDALRLTAGERRGRLAQADVAEAHVHERLELVADGRHGVEDLQRLLRGHLQDVRDGVPAVVDLQRLAVVALAAADLAGHVDVRQELHLDLQDAVALAVLAAAALDVEAEAPGPVAPHACLRHAREELADGPEEARVRGRVGARRAADGALVDVDDLVDGLRALQGIVGARLDARAADAAGQGPVEDVRDERGLARARRRP